MMPGQSEMFLERIEVTGVRLAYSMLTSSTTWSLGRPEGETEIIYFHQTHHCKICYSQPNLILLLTSPISAEFGYSEGDNPLSPGTTAWGVIGMAKDGFDYICARYKAKWAKSNYAYSVMD